MRTIFVMVGLALFCFMCGCSSREPDFTAILSEASGVTDGSPVEWKGLVIGEVTDVRIKGGKVSVTGSFSVDLESRPFNGVMARALPSGSSENPAKLLLIGGDDPSKGSLPAGAIVQEASLIKSYEHLGFIEWCAASGVVSASQIGMVVLWGAGLLVFLFVRGIVKVIVFLALAVALLVGVFKGYEAWNAYHANTGTGGVTAFIDAIKLAAEKGNTEELVSIIRSQATNFNPQALEKALTDPAIRSGFISNISIHAESIAKDGGKLISVVDDYLQDQSVTNRVQ